MLKKDADASSSPNFGDDDDVLLWGAAAIGHEINRTPRQAFYLLENGLIEGAEKVGDQWTGRRRILRRIGAAGAR